MIDIIFALFLGVFFRLIVMALLPKVHRKNSMYWDMSIMVGVIGIIGYILTNGFYVDNLNNIGLCLGFFSLDIVLGTLKTKEKLL